MTGDSTGAVEARRQQALLAAIGNAGADALASGLSHSAERVRHGLAAYRANAAAVAERALSAAFPTVRTMVGADDFAHLASECWLAHPPDRGDLAEWGDAFPAWLEAHPALAGWPYLGDCARLDLALHRNERAADADFDGASLGLLASVDPADLLLCLMPGSAVLRSRWPIASIHEAHRRDNDSASDSDGRSDADAGFAAVRSALAAGQGESVLVTRKGWRALPHRIDDADAAWCDSLLAGASLAEALTQAGERFDFSVWLVDAVRLSWLQCVARRGD